MKQYIYNDIFKGKARELLIIGQMDRAEYRVYCENNMIGIMLKDPSKPLEQQWSTVYNLLKPIAKKLGKHIDDANEV